ncbi:uncharacterized protein MYCFIDRAFT_135231 [Pseudocercospora fijiensis CIRAD86]|uniref:methionyl-tRNA formyltransferase n=1 Tax=Pseudocercospora fijiensis (strain CIRAD86) TaxID=383855 RepID=M3B661_PSEFD|nr:uncharacterized protein MYCFIDRAFT_135231 [Pseudocercospora fijiensis CIRAD86]EME84857.1 hypothetical protein MYCFIDRAFT_135231 [Pseudocercospora fijiensis CIRAD86]
MLLPFRARRLDLRSCRALHSPGQIPSLSAARKAHDPLRILFCGADDFSSHSLRALHELTEKHPETVASIDVVCRPDKRTGRGLKHTRQVPIKATAQSFNLPIHHLDTFTGWSPPSPIDLIVAVSFGLLVPGRLLRNARYGGLNVHPSLLPDLRGPSPLQYALMLRRNKTGVSLQTMHPTKFDHGIILAQDEYHIPADCTLEHLASTLGQKGAVLLRSAIETAAFVDTEPAGIINAAGSEQIDHAPKITKEDSHIDWGTWAADKVIRYGRVFDLWDETLHQACFAGKSARVKYHGPWRVIEDSASVSLIHAGSASGPGQPIAFRQHGRKETNLAILTADGKLVVPSSASIEGRKEGGGIQALTQALSRSERVHTSGEAETT